MNKPSIAPLPKLTTLLYFFAFIAQGLFMSVLGPTLPGLAEHTRTGLAAMGFLFTARSFGYLLGSLRGGQVYDQVPGHKVLVILLLIMSGAIALAPVVTQLWLLTLVLLFLGIGSGALDVGINLLLVWIHRKNAGPFLNTMHFFFGVGSFLGPIIAAQVLQFHGDIHWAYWLMALYPLPLALIFFRLPSPAAPAIDTDSAMIQPPALLVILVALFLALYVGAEAGFGGWVYSYATILNLGSETSAALLNSAFWGAITAGRLLGIPLSARFRAQQILAVDLLGSLVSISLVLLFPHSPEVLWMGSIGLGLCMASIFPTMLAYAGRRMPMSGRATRWFFVGAGAGGMTMPWLIGILFERIGPGSFVAAIFIDLVLALGVFIKSTSFHQTSVDRPGIAR